MPHFRPERFVLFVLGPKEPSTTVPTKYDEDYYYNITRAIMCRSQLRNARRHALIKFTKFLMKLATQQKAKPRVDLYTQGGCCHYETFICC